MRKRLWKISVTTTLNTEDAVGEMLGGLCKSVPSSFFDFEKKISRVTVFVPTKVPASCREKLREGLNHIRNCGLEIGTGKISISKVRREDWAESWKRHFKPIEIEKALLIKPGWSKKRPRKGQSVVVLNPGLSFGTGQHPTTMYCLQQIARSCGRLRDHSSKNKLSFLDIGTGSGILAIAAAKLGCQPVHAMDFDPEAVRAARANAQFNGVKIQIERADVAKLPIKPKERFKIICANLISGLLIEQSKRIVAQLDANGILMLAGILKSEFLEVCRAFKKLGLKLIYAKSQKEWQSGTFRFA